MKFEEIMRRKIRPVCGLTAFRIVLIFEAQKLGTKNL